MGKKSGEIKKDLGDLNIPTTPADDLQKSNEGDLGNLNPESVNKPADLGDLNTKPTKTVDLGRLNLPKFKKFKVIKK